MKNFIFFSLIILSSCGKNHKGSGSREEAISIQQMQDEVLGNYRVVLRTINPRVHGYIATGSAKITSKNDSFEINLVMDDATNSPHMQNIYTGSTCPDDSADTNNDGYVDILEAETIIGKVLIPLDGDLSSPERGRGQDPAGSAYSYTKKAALTQILSDLPDQSLQLEGRVVLVHGVRGGVKLPETVASWNERSKHQTLPITCGVIERVSN